MSAGAVAMLVVAIVIVWGGLVASVVHLRRHPDEGPPESG
ncbi:methionine/alanine import family NSS transporter small subunit [Jiangella rhizosphaerae]|uniref:Methionine/alanine import family NSS transporter small subunit n=1 Tax=Jiangella rhizosphaerae TaxID=2293569 RepID=A0A418KWG4_9ACTN|nr:methionine/alanine import family NSS transporter small subunit [Jiangella rhizosphaerae]RIQ35669.1 methionine/alanine import family NSS transporter small subunit [Jiangella rhizosphaerae]